MGLAQLLLEWDDDFVTNELPMRKALDGER